MKEKFVLYGHPLLPCSRSIEVFNFKGALKTGHNDVGVKILVTFTLNVGNRDRHRGHQKCIVHI